MIQWMTRRMYDSYGIIADINLLQSVPGKNRLPDDLYFALMETRRIF
jgi:hypothetical protein